jgi:hypothetical protein
VRHHGEEQQKDIVGVILSSFAWSQTLPNEYPRGIVTMTTDRRGIFLNEDDYFFRTFYGDKCFDAGIHYWEVIADSRTEHELKIGVSKS